MERAKRIASIFESVRDNLWYLGMLIVFVGESPSIGLTALSESISLTPNNSSIVLRPFSLGAEKRQRTEKSSLVKKEERNIIPHIFVQGVPEKLANLIANGNTPSIKSMYLGHG